LDHAARYPGREIIYRYFSSGFYAGSFSFSFSSNRRRIDIASTWQKTQRANDNCIMSRRECYLFIEMNILSSRGGEGAPRIVETKLNKEDASSRAHFVLILQSEDSRATNDPAVHYLLDITDHRISRILAKRRHPFVAENPDGRSR